jgi:hypothetical protein
MGCNTVLNKTTTSRSYRFRGVCPTRIASDCPILGRVSNPPLPRKRGVIGCVSYSSDGKSGLAKDYRPWQGAVMPQMQFGADIAARMKGAGAKVLRASSDLPPMKLAGVVFDAMHLAGVGGGLDGGQTVASDRTGAGVGNGRTAAMDRVGAAVLNAAAGTLPEDLAMKIYEAMSRAGAGVGNG